MRSCCSRHLHNHTSINIPIEESISSTRLYHNRSCLKFGHYNGTQTRTHSRDESMQLQASPQPYKHKHSNKREHSFSKLFHNRSCHKLEIITAHKQEIILEMRACCSGHLHNHSSINIPKRGHSFSRLYHNRSCHKLGIITAHKQEFMLEMRACCSRHLSQPFNINIQNEKSILSLYTTIAIHAINWAL